MFNKMPTWEALTKQMIWKQLGSIQNQKILDFGSGNGATANYYAKDNEVIAIEPSLEILENKFYEHEYQQVIGSINELKQFADESFDVILCHNVLEYADDRESIVKEFYRLLKPNGLLSIVKHNHAGRVMQMVVLLNEFERANHLLDGNTDSARQFGVIHYYEDEDLIKWCEGLKMTKTLGIRTFWHLQQNQDIQKDVDWQEKILQIEMRVSEIPEYKNIAFFHHLFLTK